MSKVGIVRTILIVAAFAALELLCRVGVIDRVTMIPPSEMVAALWAILRSGRFNDDILFTLYNAVAAALLAIVAGFFAGAVVVVPPARVMVIVANPVPTLLLTL